MSPETGLGVEVDRERIETLAVVTAIRGPEQLVRGG
jgi:hypothetical protein